MTVDNKATSARFEGKFTVNFTYEVEKTEESNSSTSSDEPISPVREKPAQVHAPVSLASPDNAEFYSEMEATRKVVPPVPKPEPKPKPSPQPVELKPVKTLAEQLREK